MYQCDILFASTYWLDTMGDMNTRFRTNCTLISFLFHFSPCFCCIFEHILTGQLMFCTSLYTDVFWHGKNIYFGFHMELYKNDMELFESKTVTRRRRKKGMHSILINSDWQSVIVRSIPRTSLFRFYFFKWMQKEYVMSDTF